MRSYRGGDWTKLFGLPGEPDTLGFEVEVDQVPLTLFIL